MGHTYQTLRFGVLEIKDENILLIPEGLLGFPQCKRYVLLEDTEQAPFQWLQSLDNTDLSFVVVDPVIIKPDYQIQVSREEVETLDLEDPLKARIYVIVVVPKEMNRVSANLKGPIVVNPDNRRAKQIVLMDERYPTRYFFMEEVQENSEKDSDEPRNE